MKTKFIFHRINKIQELRSLPTEYGVEVDIRSSANELICAHDPFCGGEVFLGWVKAYNHSLLVLNIKEEGIESVALKILRENKIHNYFLLDVSFPFTVKLANKGIKKIAYRVSDLEFLELDKFNNNNLQWIWLDAFHSFPSDELEKLHFLRDNFAVKICLVSPELHLDRNQEISNKILQEIQESNFFFDAICTKNSNLWK